MARKKTAMDYFVIPKTRKSGIYAIVNWEDMACYVGSTNDLKRRAQAHKTALMSGKHVCKKLQNAKDNNKILRFVVLREIDRYIVKSDLILLEYCYMLEMIRQSFDLYNTQPKSKYNESQLDCLSWHITCSILYSHLHADKYIDKALKQEYGINAGYMRNTKYRESKAKQEI